MRREVLQVIEDPFRINFGVGWLQGEDAHFFRAARHHGFEIWMDKSVLAEHHEGSFHVPGKVHPDFMEVAIRHVQEKVEEREKQERLYESMKDQLGKIIRIDEHG